MALFINGYMLACWIIASLMSSIRSCLAQCLVYQVTRQALLNMPEECLMAYPDLEIKAG